MVKARKYHGWTQDKAAAVLGIARPTIGAYEEGRATPRPDKLSKICEGYQINDIHKFLTDHNFDMAVDRCSNVKTTSLLDKKFKAAPTFVKKAIQELLGI